MHSLLNVLLNVAYCDKKVQEIRVLKYNDNYYVDGGGVNEWHNGESQQKHKAQKAQIKKELLPKIIKMVGLVHSRGWKIIIIITIIISLFHFG